MGTLFKFQLIVLLACTNMLFGNLYNQIFYQALFSNSLTTINTALNTLDKGQSMSVNVAYKGGLLMKKSGFMQTAAAKIKIFKEGYKLLEGEIGKYPQNAEYRFIRLTIQEHAPKLLKYNKNIKQDKILVLEAYNTLSLKLRRYILEYAQQSNVLSINDLR